MQVGASGLSSQCRVDDLEPRHYLGVGDLWREAAADGCLEFKRIDQGWRSVRLVLRAPEIVENRHVDEVDHEPPDADITRDRIDVVRWHEMAVAASNRGAATVM